MGKSKPIFYIGNQDNIAFLLGREAVRRGIPFHCAMRKASINRSDPAFLGYSHREISSWFHVGMDNYRRLLAFLANEAPPAIVISTGIEIQDMLSIERSDHKYMIIPTGSDLAMWPFVDESTALLSNYLHYRNIFYRNRHKISHILTSQLDCVYASRALGLAACLVPFRYPVPADIIDKQARLMIPGTEDSQHIVLFPARKNGDPKYSNYKGAEMIPQAVEIARMHMKPDIFSSVTWASVIHSNGKSLSYSHIDYNLDMDRVMQESLLSKRHINLKNLTSLQYWSILKDHRIIVVDQFGQFHGNIGGISREALICGRPVVTGGVGASDYMITNLYKDSLPIYEAHTPEQIAGHIKFLVEQDMDTKAKASESSAEWARSRFGCSQALDCLLAAVN